MLIQADAFKLPYPDKLFHACVTSPPYWGLRKYSGEQERMYGGDANCEHEFLEGKPANYRSNDSNPGPLQSIATQNRDMLKSHSCSKCGAYFGGLGLEPTPELHIQNMVEVFREVRRVLRDDGVCWLNYGDCFASGSVKRHGGWDGNNKNPDGTARTSRLSGQQMSGVIDCDVPQGSLMLMPHRLAIALQADGWIVRNDLVWFKRNPMPESVAGWRWERKRTKVGDAPNPHPSKIEGGKDRTPHLPGSSVWDLHTPEWEYGDDYVLRKASWRHTRAHEYVFQLTKSMGYYCNQEAVREVYNPASIKRSHYPTNKIGKGLEFAGGASHAKGVEHKENITPNPSGRNPRSVLDVPTAPYSGAHYATFPPKLIAPLIRASVPRRCCPECGMAWAPVVEKQTPPWSEDNRKFGEHAPTSTTKPSGPKLMEWINTHPNTVTDYRPTCECGVTEHEPGIVLDIFGGSGTTGMVAKELMRRWVVMDISRPYLDEQAKVRTGSGTPSKALEGLPMFEEEDDE